MKELFDYCVKTTTEIQNDRERYERIRNETKEKNIKHWHEKKIIAYDLAYEHIIKDAEEKIKGACEKGYFRTDLLSCRKSDNLQFNGIYISDILKKGFNHPGDVMKRLMEHFAPFRISFKTISLRTSTDVRYVVSVSWMNNMENRGPRVSTVTNSTPSD